MASSTEVYPKKRFCLNVTLKIKADRREEFLTCIRGNEKGTLGTEPLALMYVVSFLLLTSGTCIV